jgi:MFS transporter, SP family, xylose:H+ symportor
VGINVVLYYATDIFKGMGFSTNASLFQTIVVGAVNLTFTVVAILTVDHYGRRPLQIIGALVMAVSMISLGTDFWLGGKGIIALAAMLVYTAGFAMSWGPVTWVLLSEIFPNQIRGKAMALAVATQWVANYLVSWTFSHPRQEPIPGGALQAWFCVLDIRGNERPGRIIHVENGSRNKGPLTGTDGSDLADA